MIRFLKEPLLHFLAAGLCLFLLFEFAANDKVAPAGKVIDVDRESLLTFIQFRTRAFNRERAAARLDTMSGAELERTINEYVREEALYREALALGLNENDYIIKRRMVQSIEFVTDGFVTAAIEVSDSDLKSYYAANREDYFIPPVVTFTHVFVDIENRDAGEADRLAVAKLAELNERDVPFEDATRHGDRFPYFVNYVERDPEFVASHFGTEMAGQLFALEADVSTWRGPFKSAYGLHLVLLARKEDGRYSGPAEIENDLRRDAERAATREQQEKAIQSIVDTYEVRRDSGRLQIDSEQ